MRERPLVKFRRVIGTEFCVERPLAVLGSKNGGLGIDQ